MFKNHIVRGPWAGAGHAPAGRGGMMNPRGGAGYGQGYSDIADNAPRTGYAQPGYAPQGYAPQGYGPQTGRMWGPGQGFQGLQYMDGTVPVDAGAMGWPCATECCPVPPPTTGAPKLVGLPDVEIPACSCGVVVETSVCAPFTVLGLFIPDTIARCLSLTRFRVGCSDLLINCDPIPAELFSCCEIDENMLGGTTVAANSPICLTFDNKCKADIEFEGAIKGIACMACP